MMNRSIVTRLLRTSPLAIALACTTPTYPATGLVIRTDRSAYAYQTSMGPRIEVTIENTSPRTVTLGSCTAHVIPMMEQARGDTWSDATREGCVNIPFEPIPLAPGESIRSHVNPIALGEYRLRAPLYQDPSRLRYSRETSPTFEVR